MHACLVGQDCQEPGPEGPFEVEAVQVPEDIQERVLGDILSRLAVVGHQEGGSQGGVLIGADDPRAGVVVTLATARQPAPLLPLIALHHHALSSTRFCLLYAGGGRLVPVVRDACCVTRCVSTGHCR